MKRMILAAAAALVVAAPAAAAPSKFVVFGDSFIDSGNIQAAVGDSFTDPDLGYFRGRFSDGWNWVDYLGFANLGDTTKASLLGGTNFAFGGARGAGDDIVGPGLAIPGLASQGGLFLASTGGVVDPEAFYIINFGNNDVSAIQNGDTEGLSIAEYQAAYVANMVGTVTFLNAAGAKNILIAGVPNPLEPEGVFLQSLLDAELDAVQPFLTASLYRFDYFAFFTSLLADPTQYGLPADLNFFTPCLVAEIPGPDIDCSGYLSFDGIHVTRGVQQAISIEVARLTGLDAVPEPATWGMMIAGFGVVGVAMRRRRVLAAV
jgi:phospholipase/lecithinase/hemolysin